MSWHFTRGKFKETFIIPPPAAWGKLSLNENQMIILLLSPIITPYLQSIHTNTLANNDYM